jgi:hypothetical protein
MLAPRVAAVQRRAVHSPHRGAASGAAEIAPVEPYPGHAGEGRSDRRERTRQGTELGHGDRLAPNVPGCIVEVEDAAGHMGLDPEAQIAADVLWLRDGVAPGGARTAA